MSIRTIILATAALLGGVAQSATAATFVAATGTSPTLLGTFGPGTYRITATGTVGLVSDGSSFTIDANGQPVGTVTAPGYDYFNPNGSFIADGAFGVGGTVGRIGALLGTLSAAPTGPGDYFLIGGSISVTLTAPGAIYGQVNDLATAYGNNTDGFTVSISAVPEPATWAMMIIGFGLVGGVARRRAGATAAAA